MNATKILKWITLSFSLLGVTCLIAVKLIGSTVDQAGFLHEPFPLIAIGSCSILLAIISFIFWCIIAGYQKLFRRNN